MRLACLAALLLTAADARAQDGAHGFGFVYWVVTDGQPVVTAVAKGSAAQRAGLVPGDSLLWADGEALTGMSQDHVREAIDAAQADGPTVDFRIVRTGKERTVRIEQAPYEPGDALRRSRMFYCQSGDCLDGTGVWRAPDGERYEGTFADGWREGQGTLALANGDLYIGAFQRGRIDGTGTYVWADGARYVGEIWDGSPWGRGTWLHVDGSIYVGETFDGQREGAGTFRRTDGTYWTGTWERDLGLHGTDHAADGTVLGVGPFAE